MKVTGNPRASAVALLLRCEKQGSYANLALDAYLDRSEMSDPDKRLLTALVYGVIERKITFDHILNCLSNRENTEIDPRVRFIIYTAFYQLMFMDRIPPHAVLNEAVAYGKQLCGPGAATFINAVLRSMQRKGTELSSYTDGLKGDTLLSVMYSVPLWLVAMWREAYGTEQTEKILQAGFDKPRVTLCVNTLKISVDDFCKKVIDAGISPERLGSNALLLPSVPIKNIPGFDEGLFFVQDFSCQQAILALSPRPGDTVIDVCSAPGGKSFRSAIAMQNNGNIYSFDIHENRLSVVNENAKRLGISILHTKAADGRILQSELVETADCVICDVPCSGLGVLAKKPDIRNKKTADIGTLPATQKAILEAASQYVKTGGKLIYATCTLSPVENENITNAFLETHPNFTRENGCPCTIFPDRLHDGFFYDIFIKR